MARYLMLDIGAGTMDILYYDDTSDLHYKAVVKSPVRHLAETIDGTSGNLIVTGDEMGGGPVSSRLKERAIRWDVAMSRSAAATIHHDLDRVRGLGIRIVDDEEALGLRDQPEYTAVSTGDFQFERVRNIVEGFGVACVFDAVGVCAQDHGVPPAGESHLDYRHRLFRDRLDKSPYPHALLYESEKVPATFNRLKSIAECAKMLQAEETYLMDSGMAAIHGAYSDTQAAGKSRVLVLDIATSHTVGAAFEQTELAGFFEYHTHDITPERLAHLVVSLANGDLSHKQILQEGGHGAYVRKGIGFDATDILLATGPKRQILQGTRLPVVYGAPFGDNMMTGTFGLLDAIRRRKQLPPINRL